MIPVAADLTEADSVITAKIRAIADCQPAFIDMEEYAALLALDDLRLVEQRETVNGYWLHQGGVEIIADPNCEDKHHEFEKTEHWNFEDEYWRCRLCDWEIFRNDDLYWDDMPVCEEWMKPSPKPYVRQTGQGVLM